MKLLKMNSETKMQEIAEKNAVFIVTKASIDVNKNSTIKSKIAVNWWTFRRH